MPAVPKSAQYTAQETSTEQSKIKYRIVNMQLRFRNSSMSIKSNL